MNVLGPHDGMQEGLNSGSPVHFVKWQTCRANNLYSCNVLTMDRTLF